MIFALIIGAYALLLLVAMMGYALYPGNRRNDVEPQNVSILIAARNEEGKIGKCLRSIKDQDYPKQFVEIIVVDDASADNSFNEAAEALSVSGFKHKIIRNQQHLGKKQSLKLAIAQSNSEYIITRDADTFTSSNNWLRVIMQHMIFSKKEFIICPVAIAHEQGVLSSLQEIEMAIISLFTISSAYLKIPFLCNGANLAFTKKMFYEAGAYKEHMHVASGDDIFFLEKVKKIDRTKIGYLRDKDAIVFTWPENNLSSLVNQKVRWSTKVFTNTNVINWLSAVIIALTNVAWIGAIFYLIFEGQNWQLGLFFILSKLLIDILLVFLASGFIKVKTGALNVVITGIIYPFYASFISVLSVFIKPKWKSN